MKKLTRVIMATTLLCTFCVQAANRYWVNTSTGFYTNSANWASSEGGTGGQSVPVSVDYAYFNNAGTYTVVLDTLATNQYLYFDPGNSPGASDITLDFANGGCLYVASAGTSIIRFNNKNATLTGGTIDASVGGGANANLISDATLTVGAGATFITRGTNNGELRLGSTGAGNGIFVRDGGNFLAVSNTVNIGSSATSHGNILSVRGAGSRFAHTNTVAGVGTLRVGNSGYSNRLEIAEGGEVEVATLNIGHASGSHSNTALVGPGGKLKAGTITIGNNSNATNNTLVVEPGGMLEFTTILFGNNASANDNGVWLMGTNTTLNAGVTNFLGAIFTVGSSGTGNKMFVSDATLVLERASGGDYVMISQRESLLSLTNTTFDIRVRTTNSRTSFFGSSAVDGMFRAVDSDISILYSSPQINTGSGNTMWLDNSVFTASANGFQINGSDNFVVLTRGSEFNVGGLSFGTRCGLVATNSSVAVDGTMSTAASDFLLEMADSTFTWNGYWRLGDSTTLNSNFVIRVSGTNGFFRSLPGGGMEIGRASGARGLRMEILDGGTFDFSGNMTFGASGGEHRMLVRGAKEGKAATLDVNTFRLGNNATVFDCRADILDGGLAKTRTGAFSLGTTTAPNGAGHTVYVRDAGISSAGAINIYDKCTLHVEGMSDVKADGALLMRDGTLEVTFGKDGFKPIESASWNVGTGYNPKLIVNAAEFQKKGGSGWHTIATNTTAFTTGNGRRFKDDADVTLLYDGANVKKHYVETATEVKIYVPLSGTLIIIR